MKKLALALANENLPESDLQSRDAAAVLHPFTPIAGDKAQLRLFDAADGVRLSAPDGRAWIDGMAGLWCVNVGYGRREITSAIAEASSRLAFSHSFGGTANPTSTKLAERLLGVLPKHIRRVYFCNSGSEANDSNVKLVWLYNQLRGKPAKRKIIARSRGYHGSTVFSATLSGLDYMHEGFGRSDSDIVRVSPAYPYRDKVGHEPHLIDAYVRELADELERVILHEGPETVGAFIAEPVPGGGGVLPPPRGYFAAIKAVLDRYNVLFIADEVICGFGRLGSWFGSDLFGIEPDLMTLAKGLTSGYQPMAAVAVGERVWNVLERQRDKVSGFNHGYTWAGHPVAAAAALANLDIIENEGLVQRASESGVLLRSLLTDRLHDHPHVGDIRGVGLLNAVEFVSNQASRAPFASNEKVGPSIAAAAFARGAIVRPLPQGDILAFSPPLNISSEDLVRLADIFAGSVDEVLGRAAAARRAARDS